MTQFARSVHLVPTHAGRSKLDYEARSRLAHTHEQGGLPAVGDIHGVGCVFSILSPAGGLFAGRNCDRFHTDPDNFIELEG